MFSLEREKSLRRNNNNNNFFLQWSCKKKFFFTKLLINYALCKLTLGTMHIYNSGRARFFSPVGFFFHFTICLINYHANCSPFPIGTISCTQINFLSQLTYTHRAAQRINKKNRKVNYLFFLLDKTKPNRHHPQCSC